MIEDAAQAWGAEWQGTKAGALGDAAAFSFYPTKNLSAAGDAGMVTTQSEEIAERGRMLRQHGMRRRYYHDEVGWNTRMDGFQGAILEVKLKHVIRTARRDALREFLTSRKIGSEVYYPVPLHLQEALKGLGYGEGSFPEAERAAGEVLALPIFPELREDEQGIVVGAIAEFLS